MNGRRNRANDAGSRFTLRARLMVSDALGIGSAALLTSTLFSYAEDVAARSAIHVAAAVFLGITFARWQRLYQASRSSSRSVELTAIVRVAAMLGVASAVADALTGSSTDLARAGTLAILTGALFTLSRSLFRAWLRARRSRGDYVRPVVIVGANADAARIVDVVHDHRESGFSVVGLCSDVDADDAGLRQMWRGRVEDAAGLVREGAVTGAIVVASALDSATLNQVVRDITAAGGHVHISSGLHGLASHRIVSEPIAHEPLLHIHPTQLDPRQAVTKRVMDIVLSIVLLIVTAPVTLAAIAAIKLSDRGPGVFRQVRVGRDNTTFALLKLRTMEIGAEQQVEELADANTRSGPLFKVADDPRVTPVGRFLRATSIDELPQLWNVLKGEMSLVGPRPALPAEAEAFPEALSKRTNVPPGVTGLWQVEARDNPSFEAYARLDLFYVENWTLTFDLVILLATVESEIARLFSSIFGRRQTRRDAKLREAAAGDTVTADARLRSVGKPSTLVD